MINIMYLVLTALLALNVSAEIFNAFEMVDEGLNTANKSLDTSNDAVPAQIKESAKKKASLKVYADKVDPAREVSSNATAYIDNLVDMLIDESGDRNGAKDDGDFVMVKDKKELKGKKDYAATTRFMVDEGKGQELKEKMLAIKEEFLQFVDEEDRAAFAANLPIDIDEDAWQNSPNAKKNWSDFTFGHMPLGATMPIFSKFKNDIKSSEASVLNYLASKVGLTSDVVLDNFTVVSAPEKSYIIKGEKFKTDVFLSASAGADSNTGISVSVNGRRLNTNKDGVATFEETANSLGKKKYTATASITNPVTGETDTYKKEFEYEVGERSVAVSATKMNVFYIGVDNPVAVTAAGVPSNQIKVSMGGAGGGSISPSGGNYNVKVTRPTKKGEFAKINITAPGLSESRDFRVKRIPDPTPKVGKSKGGSMSAGELKVQPGVFPVLEGFDFDAKCAIKGFRMVRIPKRQDPQLAQNPGGKFGGDAKAIINKARPGDVYLIDGIKCSCPGDPAPRDLGSMSFRIK
jgi:gliding motility-associated protein GldM